MIYGNGSVERTISGGALDKNHNVHSGLSYERGKSISNIDYAFNTNVNGNLEVKHENQIVSNSNTYALGDVLKIERKDGMINYFKNGVLLTTLAESSSHMGEPLLFDFAINQAGKSLFNVQLKSLGFGNQNGRLAYRYGFNQMEKDDEWKGAGNSYTTEFRINDPRLGKWLSIDPLAHKFPWQSPYVSMDNNPIALTDPFGLSTTKYEDEAGNLLLDTKDGSDDVVTISDDKLEDFKFYGESYKNDGMKPLYDSKAWNDNNKADILGFETIGDMENILGGFTTQWARQNAIDFLQDPSAWNAIAMSGSEALSQWTDPQKLMMAATLLVGGYASSTLRTNVNLVDDAVLQARRYLGTDYRAIVNKAGDRIFMSKDGLRKMRFDIKNTHGDKPHLHIEQYSNGKWRDAIPGTHRIYPK
jgi:RHS repeat-associated protein